MTPSPRLLQNTPARSLPEVYRTLQQAPLETPEELKAFYREELNEVRGGDKMQRIQMRLRRAYSDGIPFKACVMGHRGVGKSTEISRLLERVKGQFRAIRFSAMTALDPGNFRALDVLLLMMAEVTEQTNRPVEQGGAGKRPSEQRLQEIWDWFATETEMRSQAQDTALQLAAGAGIQADSLWGKVLGLFANLKSEIKFASTRKVEIVDYRISRLTKLIDIANTLLDECNEHLRMSSGHEWLFVGEDFDRAGIPNERTEELFVTYANLFQDLRTHLIFTLPIGLYYSSTAPRLPFPMDCSFVIPDTPVYDPLHKLNRRGCTAVAKVLQARMDLNLFEKNQLIRVAIASGGNLRDLFALVNYAADTAQLRSAAQISAADLDAAIVNLRSDYERRLGQSPYDREVVTYDHKVERMKRIYAGDQEAQMTDPVMYSLLNSRAVQEFNGQRWFGIHPMVVDILGRQGHLTAGKQGRFPGGTI
ncbi:MAG: hypothetical protein OHK0037_25530 [Elainellaceae cyanobacterium]